MSFKISVIMPIYNAKENLKRSVDSIIQQTIGFENIELILVDDASTDNSRTIINEYADNYNNIIPLFLKENSGNASTPRNCGIKQARSDYIMFIDSDDEYEETLCEQFYNTILSEDVDLVSCNYNVTDHIHSSKIDFNFNFENQIEDTDKIRITSDNLVEFDNVYIWNKIFKKSIIINNKLLFKESISEDFIFCIEYLLKSDSRIYLKNYYGYNKFLQEESLSIKEISLNSVYNHISVDYMIYNLIKDHFKNRNQVNKICNNIFKIPITWIIEEFVTLPNSKDIKKGLIKLNNLEKDIKFENSLDNPLLNTINNLILKEKWTLAIIILKIGKIFLNSNITRKVYRKISEN